MSTTFFRGENPLKADKLNSAFAERVSRSGDTMLGRLTLAGDPVAAFDAATKQYVDRFTSVGVPTGAYVGAAPPGNVIAPLWWDTVSGQLFIQYNDGTSTQWVQANSIDTSPLYGQFLPLAGGEMTGELKVTMPAGRLATFFRYGYDATTPAMAIQSAGSTANNTTFRTLDVSAQTVHDDGPYGAEGILYSQLQVSGKSRTDLYPIHALIYTNNLRSDLTYNEPESSQHGGIVTQSVKNSPPGGVPTGKRLPDIFTHWWQTINTSNEGSRKGGADLCLEADIVGNGPDDAWKDNTLFVRTGNTTSGSPTITGMTDTSIYTVGGAINVAQTGDTYIMSRVVSKTANSITMDVNATATITGTIVGPLGGLRFSFQNVLSVSKLVADGGKPMEWSFGHYQNNQFDGTGVAAWGVGFAYYGAYYIAASDYSAGHSTASPYSADSTDRGVAIKLAPGQKIAVDGDGYRGTWITGVAGGGLNIVKDGSPILRVSATGQITFGTLPTNAANDAAAASASVPVNGVYRNASVMMVRTV